uniref:Uncharacterized protein n=1 Tax=Arundo donax TaxID=35708 RepID=A0A0A9F4F7_ARUDO
MFIPSTGNSHKKFPGQPIMENI